MSALKSKFSHLFHKSTPAVGETMPLIIRSNMLQSGIESTRFVRKVEICTAVAAGNDSWGTPVKKTHRHTLLRVHSDPTTSEDTSEGVLLVERVLSTAGEFHSITPIDGKLSAGGTLFHPDIHDRICTISEGPSTEFAHGLEVERTVTFGAEDLTLAQLGQILDFVSRATILVCAGGNCKLESRSFAFTCMAALSPCLPPPILTSSAGENMTAGTEHNAAPVNDSVIELASETFLAQVPWLFKDTASTKTIALIKELKNRPAGAPDAHLFH